MKQSIRFAGFALVFVSVFAGATMLYAQTFPSSSPYTECVAPHIRSYEDQIFALQQTYEQQIFQLMGQRADARIVAWTIPERSARSRAIRDADKVYRDGIRELNRAYKDQHKVLLRQFKDAEDVCDDQFDDDVEDGEGSSSSSFLSSSTSFVSCFFADMCIPFQSCTANVGTPVSPGPCGNQSQIQAGYYCCHPRSASSVASKGPVCGNHICESGEGLYCPPCDAFPCTQSCAIGSCPQDCSSSSSSSRRSSSSSSWIFYPTESLLPQQIESCGCKTVCDPSGSPCMAVCPAEC